MMSSVYSTPLVSASDEDSTPNEESLYFTPDVSFSCVTPQGSFRNSSIISSRSKSISDFNESTPANTPVFEELKHSSLTKNVDLDGKIWSSFRDKENNFCSTPLRYLIETPKRSRSTPLKCITNIVTPIQLESNLSRFDDQYSEYNKENNLTGNLDNSFELTNSMCKNNLMSPKLKHRVKRTSKYKSSFLQRLGIRRKSKFEYNLLAEEDLNETTSNLPPCQVNSSANFLPVNHGVRSHEKFSESENAGSGERESLFKYSENEKNVNGSRFSVLFQQEEITKRRINVLWQNFCQYPKLFAVKNMHLSPIKRLFSRCRKKMSMQSLRSIFVRRSLDDKPANVTSTSTSNKDQCQCSIVVLANQELLNKIISKLNGLEEQINDIKSVLKTNASTEKPVFNCFAPPPPPPLPPPPPPLPNLLSSTETLKRPIMTPDNSHVAKRQPLTKKQFAITVEDIKSVKLRKTPSTLKRSSAGVPQTPGTKDGVLHSVKFKPIKRSAAQKKELSNLVSEILSPSKKYDQSEKNCIPNPKILDDQENQAIANNFQITPIKCKNRSTKFRSTKFQDFSLDSPARKSVNTAFKTLVFCDNGVASRD